MPEFFVSPESQQAIQREIYHRQARFAQARQRATAQQAERLAYVNQQAPTASNQLKEAYASSPMTDEQFQQYAQREAAQRPDDSGGFFDRIGDVVHGAGMGVWNQVVKPAVRGAFTLWDAAQNELILRPLTATIESQRDDISWGQAYDRYGDSALRNIMQGDLATTDEQGNPIEDGVLGQGFLPGGQAQARTMQERQTDFGQAVAHGIWSDEGGLIGDMYGPGDAAYDITAGVAGFLGEVALDPLAWGTGGAAAAVRGAKGAAGARTLGRAVRAIPIKEGVRSPITLRRYASANEAARQVAEAGLVSTSRKNTVLLEQAERLFKNRKVLDEIAQADEYTIFRRMKLDRLGLGRGDDRLAGLIGDLGAASTPEDVSRILIDAAQRGWVRERGFYKGAGRFVPNPKERFRNFRMKMDLPEFRYGGINPNRVVSVDNKMEAARDIDATLRLAKVGEADRARIVSSAFRSTSNDEMLNVVDESIRAIGRKMRDDLGVTREQAARAAGRNIDDVAPDEDVVDILVKSHRDAMNEVRSYLLDEAGRHSPPPWKGTKTATLADGTEVDMQSASAGLLVNLAQKAIPLPDPQDIRRATTKYDGVRRVYQSTGWEMGDTAARFANRYLFKFPTLFTRFAYPVRNNLDNAARIAGAGYDSIFTNAKAYFSAGVLDPDKFRDLIMSADDALAVGRGFRSTGGRYGVVDEIIEGVDGAPSKMRARWKDTDEVFEVDDLDAFRANEVLAVSRTQEEWAEGVGALTATASGLWTDDSAKALGTWRTYRKGEKGDIKAWRQQIGRLANDPIAQRVADSSRYLNRDELIDDLIGSGLVDDVTKLGDDAKQFFFGTGTGPDRRAVNDYIDWIEGHLDNLTGGDTGLRQAIATRQLNGVNINDLSKNKRINQILREQYYDRMPAMVSGDTFIEDGTRGANGFKKSMDWLVDFMASRPENRFTRSPLLAQVFSDDLAQIMPALADDALRQQLVKAAADAGYDGNMFARIAQAAQDAAGSKGVIDNLEDAIDAAKLHSSESMLSIAFDATQRSSFQETFDAMVPFWDAFAEVGQSWGRIFRDNPNVLMRGMQAYQGARGSGFIYTNEMGEEVFAMPGGGALAKMLGMNGVGAPQFEAPVEGLNLITQGFGPGVGPMVQWGVGAFMPDTPDLQWLRDIVTPYGTSVEAPSDLANPANLLNDLTPAWMKKTFTAFSDGDYDPVAWNSAVGDALKVLATSGNYDMSDPESVRQLQADAQKAARWTTYLRAALQMGAPTGPGVAWEVETDPDGTTHRVATMAGAYYDMLQASGDETEATSAFIEMYGVEPFWIAQGKTNELVEGPRTREGLNWVQRHGDAAERHADVIGYFVPAEDPTAPPDYGVYRQRLESGEIESLTGEQQLALANKTKARTIYSVWKQRLEGLPYTQRQRQLRLVRDALTEQFPGWDADVLGVSGKLDRDRKIELLEDAAQDEALADSPVTEPLSVYLQKRRQAYEIIAQRGGATTLAAEANADLREWLGAIGQELSVRTPHFQGVWQTVLSSEVEQ